MDIASLYSVSPDYLTQYGLNKYQQAPEEKNGDFGSILDTALNMINETNAYQNAHSDRRLHSARRSVRMNWR